MRSVVWIGCVLLLGCIPLEQQVFPVEATVEPMVQPASVLAPSLQPSVPPTPATQPSTSTIKVQELTPVQKESVIQGESVVPLSEDELKQLDDELKQLENKPNLVFEGNQRFAFKLFQDLFKQQGLHENLFISPISISMVLATLYNGAGGQTKADLAKTMQLEGISVEEVNQTYELLLRYLPDTDDQESLPLILSIANALWSNTQFSHSFKPDFLKQISQIFNAQIFDLDFHSPQAAKIINQWVSDKTRHKITEIIDGGTLSALQTLIVNTVYFKGSWYEPFFPPDYDEQFVKNKTDGFLLLNGQKKKHPFMYRDRDISGFGHYIDTTVHKFEVVKLGYTGTNRRYIAMFVYLPAKDSTLESFVQQLTVENWQSWQKNTIGKVGKLYMPRFEFRYETDVTNYLPSFGTWSNFSNMVNNSVAISDIRQKTFISVDEKGTEAAAATSASVLTSAPPKSEPRPYFEMIVDRPFYFEIVDERTGTILFMGTVIDPIDAKNK